MKNRQRKLIKKLNKVESSIHQAMNALRGYLFSDTSVDSQNTRRMRYVGRRIRKINRQAILLQRCLNQEGKWL